MTFRSRIKQPAVLIRIGAAGLILFNLAHWFLHPVTSVARGFVDGASGAMLGVAIACFLIAARLNGARRAAAGCAK